MRLAGLTLAAVLCAAAGMALYLLTGAFFAAGRAEALPFIAFRPWVLLAGALLVVRQPWRRRALFYALVLLLAAASETLLVAGLGANDPWPEMLRGLAAGAVLALVLDLVFQLARRLWRWGPAVAAILLLAAFATPFVLQPYAAVVMPDEPEAADAKPKLMLMTGLPIIWGEGGAFDPSSRPAASYRMLEREFAVHPLDALSKESLAKGRLLLLAQPRALAPEELVALDDWVRRGGRVLILADPRLDWPSNLPLGDIRRPPPVSYLGPLFAHWDVALSQRGWKEPAVTDEAVPGMRLRMTAPGRLVGADCRQPLPDSFLLECDIGAGRALLVADADLLRDDLWAPIGAGAYQRIADNPLVVAAWLDRLAGIERPRVERLVEWADPDSDRTRALLLAMLPLLAGLGAALALRLKRRA